MKKIVKLLKKGKLHDAILHAVSNNVLRDQKAEQELLQIVDIKHCSMTSLKAEVVRILYQKGYLSADLKEWVETLEAVIINAKNWRKLSKMLYNAPLTLSGSGKLVWKVYYSLDEPEALNTFRFYHKIYDINTVNWPQNVEGVCKKMAQEVLSHL